VKTYRTPRDLQARIEQALTRRPSSTAAPLDEVADILCSGRHYAWIGIFLAAGPGPAPASTTEIVQPRTVIPIMLVQHVFGALAVQGEKGAPLSGKDRILLKRVATRLARFLHGPGAYLLRKAREAAAEQPLSPQARGHQPASEKPQERSLAAGEGRR